ncbi:hypothetical protein QJQ45_000669 [Haematococcus lacustris]|nr:hypothetical protein QJQ45_000669 [Haematococcus lacustris]
MQVRDLMAIKTRGMQAPLNFVPETYNDMYELLAQVDQALLLELLQAFNRTRNKLLAESAWQQQRMASHADKGCGTACETQAHDLMAIKLRGMHTPLNFVSKTYNDIYELLVQMEQPLLIQLLRAFSRKNKKLLAEAGRQQGSTIQEAALTAPDPAMHPVWSDASSPSATTLPRQAGQPLAPPSAAARAKAKCSIEARGWPCDAAGSDAAASLPPSKRPRRSAMALVGSAPLGSSAQGTSTRRCPSAAAGCADTTASTTNAVGMTLPAAPQLVGAPGVSVGVSKGRARPASRGWAEADALWEQAKQVHEGGGDDGEAMLPGSRRVTAEQDSDAQENNQVGRLLPDAGSNAWYPDSSGWGPRRGWGPRQVEADVAGHALGVQYTRAAEEEEEEAWEGPPAMKPASWSPSIQATRQPAVSSHRQRLQLLLSQKHCAAPSEYWARQPENSRARMTQAQCNAVLDLLQRMAVGARAGTAGNPPALPPLQQFDARQLNMAAWSLGKLKPHLPPAAVTSACTDLAHHSASSEAMKRSSWRDWSNLLHGLATAGMQCSSSPDLTRLCDQAVQLLPVTLARGEAGQNISMTLWGMAKSGYTGSAQPLLQSVTAAISQGEVMSDAKPQEWANLVWATSKLPDCREEARQLLDQFAIRGMRVVAGLGAQGVSNILNAMGLVLWHDKGVCRQLAELAAQTTQKKTMNGQEMANSLYGLARLGYLDSAVRSLAAGVAKADLTVFKPQDLANLLYARSMFLVHPPGSVISMSGVVAHAKLHQLTHFDAGVIVNKAVFDQLASDSERAAFMREQVRASLPEAEAWRQLLQAVGEQCAGQVEAPAAATLAAQQQQSGMSYDVGQQLTWADGAEVGVRGSYVVKVSGTATRCAAWAVPASGQLTMILQSNGDVQNQYVQADGRNNMEKEVSHTDDQKMSVHGARALRQYDSPPHPKQDMGELIIAVVKLPYLDNSKKAQQLLWRSADWARLLENSRAHMTKAKRTSVLELLQRMAGEPWSGTAGSPPVPLEQFDAAAVTPRPGHSIGCGYQLGAHLRSPAPRTCLLPWLPSIPSRTLSSSAHTLRQYDPPPRPKQNLEQLVSAVEELPFLNRSSQVQQTSQLLWCFADWARQPENSRARLTEAEIISVLDLLQHMAGEGGAGTAGDAPALLPLQQFDARQLNMAAWSLGKLKPHLPPAAVTSACTALASHSASSEAMKRGGWRDWGNLLHGLATAGMQCSSSPDLTRLCDQAVQLLPVTLARGEAGQNISMTLWGMAKSGYTGSAQPLLQSVTAAISQGEVMSDAKPQEWANLIWATSKLPDCREEARQLLDQFAIRGMRVVAGLDPQNVSNILYAMGLVLWLGKEVCSLLAERAAQTHKFMTSQAMVNTLYGLARLGYLDSSVRSLAAGVAKADLTVFKPQDLANLLYARSMFLALSIHQAVSSGHSQLASEPQLNSMAAALWRECSRRGQWGEGRWVEEDLTQLHTASQWLHFSTGGQSSLAASPALQELIAKAKIHKKNIIVKLQTVKKSDCSQLVQALAAAGHADVKQASLSQDGTHCTQLLVRGLGLTRGISVESPNFLPDGSMSGVVAHAKLHQLTHFDAGVMVNKTVFYNLASDSERAAFMREQVRASLPEAQAWRQLLQAGGGHCAGQVEAPAAATPAAQQQQAVSVSAGQQARQQGSLPLPAAQAKSAGALPSQRAGQAPGLLPRPVRPRAHDLMAIKCRGMHTTFNFVPDTYNDMYELLAQVDQAMLLQLLRAFARNNKKLLAEAGRQQGSTIQEAALTAPDPDMHPVWSDASSPTATTLPRQAAAAACADITANNTAALGLTLPAAPQVVGAHVVSLAVYKSRVRQAGRGWADADALWEQAEQVHEGGGGEGEAMLPSTSHDAAGQDSDAQESKQVGRLLPDAGSIAWYADNSVWGPRRGEEDVAGHALALRQSDPPPGPKQDMGELTIAVMKLPYLDNSKKVEQTSQLLWRFADWARQPENSRAHMTQVKSISVLELLQRMAGKPWAGTAGDPPAPLQQFDARQLSKAAWPLGKLKPHLPAAAVPSRAGHSIGSGYQLGGHLRSPAPRTCLLPWLPSIPSRTLSASAHNLRQYDPPPRPKQDLEQLVSAVDELPFLSSSSQVQQTSQLLWRFADWARQPENSRAHMIQAERNAVMTLLRHMAGGAGSGKVGNPPASPPLQQFNARQLSMAAWSLGKLRPHLPAAAVTSACTALASHSASSKAMKEGSWREWSNLLHGLATAGMQCSSSPDLTWLCDQAMQLLPQRLARGAASQAISMTLWAMAKSGYTGSAQPLLQSVTAAISQGEVMRDAKPQAWANLIWATSKLPDCREEARQLLDQFAIRGMRVVADCNAQNLSNIMYAIGMVLWHDKEVCRQLAERAVLSKRTMTSQEMANSLYGLARLGYLDSSVRSLAAGVAKADLTAFETQHLANLLYARSMFLALSIHQAVSSGHSQLASEPQLNSMAAALWRECSRRGQGDGQWSDEGYVQLYTASQWLHSCTGGQISLAASPTLQELLARAKSYPKNTIFKLQTVFKSDRSQLVQALAAAGHADVKQASLSQDGTHCTQLLVRGLGLTRGISVDQSLHFLIEGSMSGVVAHAKLHQLTHFEAGVMVNKSVFDQLASDSERAALMREQVRASLPEAKAWRKLLQAALRQYDLAPRPKQDLTKLVSAVEELPFLSSKSQVEQTSQLLWCFADWVKQPENSNARMTQAQRNAVMALLQHIAEGARGGMAAKSMMVHYTAKQLSLSAWSLGKLTPHLPAAAVTSACIAIARHGASSKAMERAGWREWSILLHGLATAGMQCSNSPDLTRLCDQAVQLLPYKLARGAADQAISMTLWAMAKSGYTGSAQPLLQSVTAAISQGEVMRDAKAQAWANLIWATSKLPGCREEARQLLTLLAAKAQAVVPGLNAQNVSNILYSMSLVLWHDKEVCKQLAERAAQTQQTMSEQNMANSLYGLARLGYLDSSVRSLAAGVAKADLTAFKPQELANLLYARSVFLALSIHQAVSSGHSQLASEPQLNSMAAALWRECSRRGFDFEQMTEEHHSQLYAASQWLHACTGGQISLAVLPAVRELVASAPSRVGLQNTFLCNDYSQLVQALAAAGHRVVVNIAVFDQLASDSERAAFMREQVRASLPEAEAWRQLLQTGGGHCAGQVEAPAAATPAAQQQQAVSVSAGQQARQQGALPLPAAQAKSAGALPSQRAGQAPGLMPRPVRPRDLTKLVSAVEELPFLSSKSQVEQTSQLLWCFADWVKQPGNSNARMTQAQRNAVMALLQHIAEGARGGMAAKSMMVHYTAKQLSLSAWSLGKLTPHLPAAAVTSACIAIARHGASSKAMERAGWREWSILLHGLATAGMQCSSSPDLTRLCDQAVQLLPHKLARGAADQAISMTLWAMAKSGYTGSAQPLLQSVTAAISQGEVMRDAKAQAWANLIWANSKLPGCREEARQLLTLLAARAQAVVPGLNAQNVSNILYSMSLVLWHDKEVCKQLAERAAQTQQTMSEQNMANSLYALARLGYLGSSVRSLAAGVAKADLTAFKPQELANLLYGRSVFLALSIHQAVSSGHSQLASEPQLNSMAAALWRECSRRGQSEGQWGEENFNQLHTASQWLDACTGGQSSLAASPTLHKLVAKAKTCKKTTVVKLQTVLKGDCYQFVQALAAAGHDEVQQAVLSKDGTHCTQLLVQGPGLTRGIAVEKSLNYMPDGSMSGVVAHVKLQQATHFDAGVVVNKAAFDQLVSDSERAAFMREQVRASLPEAEAWRQLLQAGGGHCAGQVEAPAAATPAAQQQQAGSVSAGQQARQQGALPLPAAQAKSAGALPSQRACQATGLMPRPVQPRVQVRDLMVIKLRGMHTPLNFVPKTYNDMYKLLGQVDQALLVELLRAYSRTKKAKMARQQQRMTLEAALVASDLTMSTDWEDAAPTATTLPCQPSHSLTPHSAAACGMAMGDDVATRFDSALEAVLRHASVRAPYNLKRRKPGLGQQDGAVGLFGACWYKATQLWQVHDLMAIKCRGMHTPLNFVPETYNGMYELLARVDQPMLLQLLRAFSHNNKELLAGAGRQQGSTIQKGALTDPDPDMHPDWSDASSPTATTLPRQAGQPLAPPSAAAPGEAQCSIEALGWPCDAAGSEAAAALPPGKRSAMALVGSDPLSSSAQGTSTGRCPSAAAACTDTTASTTNAPGMTLLAASQLVGAHVVSLAVYKGRVRPAGSHDIAEQDSDALENNQVGRLLPDAGSNARCADSIVWGPRQAEPDVQADVAGQAVGGQYTRAVEEEAGEVQVAMKPASWPPSFQVTGQPAVSRYRQRLQLLLRQQRCAAPSECAASAAASWAALRQYDPAPRPKQDLEELVSAVDELPFLSSSSQVEQTSQLLWCFADWARQPENSRARMTQAQCTAVMDLLQRMTGRAGAGKAGTSHALPPLQQFVARQLSMAAWSLGKLKPHLPAAAVASACTALARHSASSETMKRAGWRDWSTLLHGLATAGMQCSNSPDLTWLCNQAVQQLPHKLARGAAAQDISMTLLAMAKSGYTGIAQPLLQSVTAAISQGEVMSDAKPQAWANLIWATSKLPGCREEARQLLSLFAARAQAVVPGLDAQNVSNILYTMGLLLLHDKEACRQLAERAVLTQRTMKSQEMANILYALARLGYLDSSVRSLAAGVSKADLAAFTTQDITNLLYARSMFLALSIHQAVSSGHIQLASEPQLNSMAAALWRECSRRGESEELWGKENFTQLYTASQWLYACTEGQIYLAALPALQELLAKAISPERVRIRHMHHANKHCDCQQLLKALAGAGHQPEVQQAAVSQDGTCCARLLMQRTGLTLGIAVDQTPQFLPDGSMSGVVAHVKLQQMTHFDAGVVVNEAVFDQLASDSERAAFMREQVRASLPEAEAWRQLLQTGGGHCAGQVEAPAAATPAAQQQQAVSVSAGQQARQQGALPLPAAQAKSAGALPSQRAGQAPGLMPRPVRPKV